VKKLIILFFCLTSIIFFLSSNASAANNYFTVKAGIYSPESDDLEGFDEGFNGEIAFGHYLNRNLALELGLGYFETEWSGEYCYNGYCGREKDSIDVVPLTVALKAIYPVGQLELYGLGGIGIYFSSGEAEGYVPDVGYVSLDDDDVSLGGFLGAGLNFNITNEVFFGVEGKYHWVEAEFEGIDVELDGWTFTGNLGFRF
jgi:opacity protein-like surface antigen